MNNLSLARLAVLSVLFSSISANWALPRSNVVGAVVGSRNASVKGSSVRAGQTILSGDQMKVTDGGAEVSIAAGSRILIGGNTVTSFQRGQDGVTTAITQGSVKVFYAGKPGAAPRVSSGNVWITPESGVASVGKITVSERGMFVSALEGSLRIEGAGSSVEVPSGKGVLLIRDGTSRESAGLKASKWTVAGQAAEEFPTLTQLCREEGIDDSSKNPVLTGPIDKTIDALCKSGGQNQYVKQLCFEAGSEGIHPSPHDPEYNVFVKQIDEICGVKQ